MVISTMLWRQDKQWALKCLNSRDALLLQCDCRSGRKMMPQERSMWLEGKLTVLCLATQSRLTLCDPMDSSLPGCSVHGIPQARILEWVAMPSSRGSSNSRNWTHISASLISPALAGMFFTTKPLGKHKEFMLLYFLLVICLLLWKSRVKIVFPPIHMQWSFTHQ